MKNPEKTFHWIIDLLEQERVTYRISGGLAARAHGVQRDLADIDIEMMEHDLHRIIPHVREHIIFGPDRLVDQSWDIFLTTISHNQQLVDMCGHDTKIFNQETKQWELLPVDFNCIVHKEIFGRMVPVETIESLIRYKKKLGRDVDHQDVFQLERFYFQELQNKLE